jgi:FkbM family methyltransferase
VEPLPANFNTLNSVAKAEPWASSGIRVKQLAAVLSTASNKIAYFPANAAYGDEGFGVFSQKGHSGPTAPVNTATIDEIAFGSPEADPLPTVITVDAEGLDALILLGAARTLASGDVAYIEFEYHSKPPWDSIQLEWVIGYLDNMQYDCFFAGNNGKAYKVTGCWQPSFEFHQWSNLACASRLERAPHTCWHDALEEAASA